MVMKSLSPKLSRTCLILAFAMILVPGAIAQTVEPGGRPQDVDLAINNPDEYAWQLFFFVCRQARASSAGEADPTKMIKDYDPDRDIVWETWALASGQGATQDASEVYKTNGADPGAWSSLVRGAANVPKVFSDNRKAKAVREFLLNTMPTNVQPFISPDALEPAFEVRMNRAMFEHIRANTLYNIEGLEAQLVQAQLNNNPRLIQLPKGAKEIKANWLEVANPKPEDLQRYHWRKIGNRTFLLTGFHIITKDLPNWFWADFEHVDFEADALAYTPPQPSRDSTTRGKSPPAVGSVQGERRELTGSKWANYRLRGTQVDFVDERGSPTLLGNTKIEPGFVDKSSCLTCHARATVGMRQPTGGKLPNEVAHLSPGRTDVGQPTPSEFAKGGKIQFLQTDFIWSAPFRAASKQ